MAKISQWHLGRGLKKDGQKGGFVPFRSFESLGWIGSPILFILLVYWTGHIGEQFSHSFALADELGNVLDEMPKMDCVLTSRSNTTSAAYFYAFFPHSGHYYINVFQDGIFIEGIPVDVIDVSEK